MGGKEGVVSIFRGGAWAGFKSKHSVYTSLCYLSLSKCWDICIHFRKVVYVTLRQEILADLSKESV